MDASPSDLSSSLPPPTPPERFGILDENGTMTEDFNVGEFDPDLVDKWDNGTDGSNSSQDIGKGEAGSEGKLPKFGFCLESMREYIPCLDNEEAIKKLKSTEKGERFERHCPGEGKGLNCLVPAPKDYKTPIPWPRSRDEVCTFFFSYYHFSVNLNLASN